MMHIKKHTALFFLLVFTVPVIYQTVHILQHHANHDIHHACENHHEEQEKTSNIPEDTNTLYFISTSNEKQCVICEYTFTINQIPVIYQLAASTSHSIEIKSNYKNVNHSWFELSAISPRAPPLLTFS